MMDANLIESRKARARGWFERLRDDICATFEALENALPADAPLGADAPGRFARTPWNRTDHSGVRPISDMPEIGNSSAGSASRPGAAAASCR